MHDEARRSFAGSARVVLRDAIDAQSVVVAHLKRRVSAAIHDGMKAHFRRILKARQLVALRIDGGLAPAPLFAVSVIRNERHRLPYFLKYYRAMGVTQFVFIDNGSTDGTIAFLQDEPGVSLYEARGAYKKSRYGVDWINAVLARHGHDRWILHVDVDEMLVFADDGEIGMLLDELGGTGAASLQTIMVDMYGRGSLRGTWQGDDADPLSVCPLFDPAGYAYTYVPKQNTTWIKGGVRARVFFGDVQAGPALNKTPLVFWQRHYAYLKSAHQLWPPLLNGGSRVGPQRPRAALLHFKFLGDFQAKIAEEALRGQHTSEYRSYGTPAVADLANADSTPYTGFDSLVRADMVAPLALAATVRREERPRAIATGR